MSALVFVDTNVLIYRFDSSEPEKQSQCDAWLTHLWRTGVGRVSVQVLQECYATLTRKLSHAMEPADARTVVRSLFAWEPVPIVPAIIEGAWSNQQHFSLSWWDALIVSAAQAARCDFLLTEDLNHGQVMHGVRIVNPMRVEPGALAEVRWHTGA